MSVRHYIEGVLFNPPRPLLHYPLECAADPPTAEEVQFGARQGGGYSVVRRTLAPGHAPRRLLGAPPLAL